MYAAQAPYKLYGLLLLSSLSRVALAQTPDFPTGIVLDGPTQRLEQTDGSLSFAKALGSVVTVRNGGALELFNVDVDINATNGHGVLLTGGTVTMTGPVTINVNGANNGIYMSSGQLILGSNGAQSQIHGDIGPGFKMLGGDATLTNVNIALNGATSAAGVDMTGSLSKTLNIHDSSIKAMTGGIDMGTGVLNLSATSIESGRAGITAGANADITLENFNIKTRVPGTPAAATLAHGIWISGSSTTRLTATYGYIETNGATDYGILTAGKGAAPYVIKRVDIKTSGASAWGIGNIGGSIMEVTEGSIMTSGTGSFGIQSAGAGSKITVQGTTTVTSGANAIGLLAFNGGSVVLRPGTTVTTSGTTASGLSAQVYGSVSGTGATVRTTGDNGYGMFVASDSTVNLNASDILTTGAGAHAAYLYAATNPAAPTLVQTLTISGGSIVQATGQGSAAVLSNAAGAVAYAKNRFSAADTFIHSGAGPALAALGTGTHTMTLERSTVVGGSMSGDVDGRVLHFDDGGTAGVGLNVTADNSFLRGNITVNAGRAALSLGNASWLEGAALQGAGRLEHLTIADAASGWTMTGSSRVGALTHAGTISISPPSGNMYKNLTVENAYASQGGLFELNTHLGADNSLTDTLTFQGAVSGVTNLFISNTDGIGSMTTGNGIRVIEANQAAPGAFVQGTRLAAGAYEYTLYQGQRDGTLDGNWYLRSTYGGQPVVPPVIPPQYDEYEELPDYRPEVPLAMAMPQLAFHMGTATLGNYHNRRYSASDAQASIDLEHGATVWGRTFGENFRMRPKGSDSQRFAHFSKYGPAYDFKLSGLQLGRDVVRWDGQNNARNVLGVYGGISHIDSDVSTLYEGKAGTVKMDAYSVGLYGTHRAASGAYVDVVMQGTLYERARSSASPITKIDGVFPGESFGTRGKGLILSVEGGYPFSLHGGWNIEPQAQLIYQRVSMNDPRDAYGYVQYSSADTVQVRLGQRLFKDWQMTNGRVMTGWVRTNLWHTSGSRAKTSTAGNGPDTLTLYTDPGSTRAQVGLGVGGQLSERLSLFAEADYSRSVDSRNSQGVTGRLGLTMVW